MGAILKRGKKSLPGAGGGRRVKVLGRQLRGGSLLRPPPTRSLRAPGRPWQVGSARGGRARGLRRGRKRGPGGSARPDAPGVSTGAGGGGCPAGGSDLQWCFSQVKGAIDEDVAEGKAARFCVPSPHPALGDPGLVAAPGSCPGGGASWRRARAPGPGSEAGPARRALEGARGPSLLGSWVRRAAGFRVLSAAGGRLLRLADSGDHCRNGPLGTKPGNCRGRAQVPAPALWSPVGLGPADGPRLLVFEQRVGVLRSVLSSSYCRFYS